ncbi:MAG TPA: hypothetical protein VHG09_01140, partial [Longimicrobiales bacterium]|nr:hypothetical protein [Longimicrobiales bacterium]
RSLPGELRCRARSRRGARDTAIRPVTSVVQMEAAQALAAERLEESAIVATDSAKAADAGSRGIAGRTFLLRDGMWQDAAHADGNHVIAIAAYSDAYFDVIRALPETALVLREVDSVLIAGRSVSLKIGANGAESLGAAELRDLVEAFR